MYDVIPFNDLQVGDRVSVAKTVTEADGALYIAATGDFGPVHIDEKYAAGTRFGRRLAPGIMVAGLCTSVLTAELAGVLGLSIEDRFWFTGPVFYGDTITIDVWIAERHEDTRTLVWEASAVNEAGNEVLKARATLKYPRAKPAVAT
jgi:3-hydroxybutyryl-CoA dehydratase